MYDLLERLQMMEFRKGDIFNENAEALVNPVNCVGIMGRGLALQFKKAMAPLTFNQPTYGFIASAIMTISRWTPFWSAALMSLRFYRIIFPRKPPDLMLSSII